MLKADVVKVMVVIIESERYIIVVKVLSNNQR